MALHFILTGLKRRNIMYNFRIAKEMAKALAARFGVGYVNYDGENYYSTSCLTPSTIGKVVKGKFSIVR